MTTLEMVIDNKNAEDEVLATIAQKALKAKNEDLFKKLATRPNAGPKTLSIIAK